MKSNIIGAFFIIAIKCQTTTEIQKNVPTWEQIFAIVGIFVIVIAIVLYLTKRRVQSIRQMLRQYVGEPTQAQITFVNYKDVHDLQVQAVLQTSHTIDKSQRQKTIEQDDQQLSIEQTNEKQNRNLSQVFKKKQGTKPLNSKKRLASGAKIVKSTVEDVNVNSTQDHQI